MLYRFHPRRLFTLSVLMILMSIYIIGYLWKHPIVHTIDRNHQMKIKALPPVFTAIESTTKMHDKIDWHDYESIARDAARTGLGENGLAVDRIELQWNNPKFRQSYEANGFNAFISDNISLDRSIHDTRHSKCKEKLYLAKLPSVSIIIPVRNEHLSVLLRSIHSILNRTPAKLLKEIIIVDDASRTENLTSQLYVYAVHLNKTRFIHLRKHEGLVRARLRGAREARGEILIFFDSHIEVNVNWLPPLIEPIALHYRTATCPLIDIIKWENFAYMPQDEGARGAFDWSLSYKRLPPLRSAKQNPSEPFDNPVMSGGLFAINRRWFWELGGYDEGLDIWGGEQYEMSFKIWQCGGRLIDVPCSRVGHVYRTFNPYQRYGADDYLARNYKRVALVWMDEYAEYVYQRNPLLRTTKPGLLLKQHELRKALNCKSFKWYMENVAFDTLRQYPPVPLLLYAKGEIRNMASSLCITVKVDRRHSAAGLSSCFRDSRIINNAQEFEFTWRQDIRQNGRDMCFDVPNKGRRAKVLLFGCHGMRGNQHFIYDVKNYNIRLVTTQLCLDSDPNTKTIFMEKCDKESESQRWKFSSCNQTLILRDIPL